MKENIREPFKIYTNVYDIIITYIKYSSFIL